MRFRAALYVVALLLSLGALDFVGTESAGPDPSEVGVGRSIPSLVGSAPMLADAATVLTRVDGAVDSGPVRWVRWQLATGVVTLSLAGVVVGWWGRLLKEQTAGTGLLGRACAPARAPPAHP